MKRIITAIVAALSLAAHGADINVSVNVDTNGVLRFPLAAPFAASNNLNTSTAAAASNALHSASIAAIQTTNTAQDALIGTKASTNDLNAVIATNVAQDAAITGKVSTTEMGSGLTYSNGQWIVTSQGTVTNIEINGESGVVTNGVATITLDADNVGALGTNTEFETWTNPAAGTLVYITNSVVNGTNYGVVSNGMAWLTVTASVDSSVTNGLASTNYVNSAVGAYIPTSSLPALTNWAYAASNPSNYVTATITNGLGAGDAAQWATNPATATVNMNTFSITNVASLSVTGRLAIGFGVFQSTNDVTAPTSTNTWIVYAVRVNGTNYLMGVDTETNRAWIGDTP